MRLLKRPRSFMYGYGTSKNSFLRYKLFDRTPSPSLTSSLQYFQTLPPGSRVLNLGCGDGILEYNAGAKRPYSFSSIDIEPQAIEKLSKVFLSQGRHSDIAIIGDITTLGTIETLNISTFDACISWRVLHGIHPSYYHKILKEVHNLLRPGGRLIISVASHRDWKRYALGKDYNPSGINDCNPIMFHDFGINRTTPFPVHFFTPEELMALGEAAGFEMIQHHAFEESSGYNHLKHHLNTYIFAEFVRKD